MFKNIVFIWVFYEIFEWHIEAGIGCVVVLLAYEIGREAGLKAAAAGEKFVPGHRSGKPGQTSKEKPLFPMALKAHLED